MNITLIISAVVLVSAIGAVLGVIIGVIAKKFAVEVDPKIEIVDELLPGANCGGCGFAGCADFAKALVENRTEPNKCPVCDSNAIAQIAGELGQSATEKEKIVAVVLCGGSNSHTKGNVKYNGVLDCKSANNIQGIKGCSYGCLGYASCARACPFDAIEIKDGLAIVHPHLCVGCGKCVATCPRTLIKMVPEKASVHVFCASPEKGPLKRKVCTVSCIGCTKCTKVEGEEGTVKMVGTLAEVNYDNPPTENIVDAAKCPTKCLSNRHWKQLRK